MILDIINTKLDYIMNIHSSLPTWTPLSKPYAIECGYKSVDGLRKWCYTNLPPDKFVKKGKSWYIHISALHQVKRKIV